jgi:hypothetical protein
MAAFGRLRLDVQNCIGEIVDFGLARRVSGDPPRFTFHKPSNSDVWALVASFLEGRATVSHEDQSASVRSFREMIGRDEKMLVVFEWIRTAAKSDISVLILGPTGSGKELVARMIHDLSRRSQGKFQALNCAALPDTLFESKSSATKRRVHRARSSRAASRWRTGHPLPRRDRRPLDCRAGQAAARARGAALRTARRQPIHLRRFQAHLGDEPAPRSLRARRAFPRGPPLSRERVLDPSAVAARTSGRHPGARRALPVALLRQQRPWHGRQVFGRDAVDRLVYHWPGNIRELESTVSRAALSSPGRVIRASDVEFLHTGALAQPVESTRIPTMRDAERALVLRALESVDWNKKEAARLLDISRGTLYRKVEEYGLSPTVSRRETHEPEITANSSCLVDV